MKKLLYFAALLLLCHGCQQKAPTDKPANTADTTKAVEELATTEGEDNSEPESWMEKKSRENPAYVKLAGPILKHTESAENLEEELKWVQTVQAELTAGYNNMYGNGSLPDTEKADSMAVKLSKFLENNGSTTIDMIENANIKTAFLRLQLASAYAKLIQEDKSYKAEIESWMDVEQHMMNTALIDEQLKYFGGTMAGVAGLTRKNQLLEARLNDVVKLLENHAQAKKEGTGSAAEGNDEPDGLINEDGL